MIVYCIENTTNGKKYIGKTVKNCHKRWIQHCIDSKVGNLAIHRAIRKYGKENFIIRPLVVCNDTEQMNSLEKVWIAECNTMNPKYGYNMTLGGDGCGSGKDHPLFGVKWSNEHCKRISESKKGKKFSEEHKQALRGLTRSEETKEKIRQARKFQDMSSHIKKFCNHGHDTDIVGRDLKSYCKECKKLSRKTQQVSNREVELI